MVNAAAPYVYGMGGRAPVLIEVTASQATADGLPIRITRLRPSGERMEGRGCTIAGCQPGADVPVLQCGQTLTWPSRGVVVRLDSSVHQAAVVSVSQCNSELGVFRVFPAGQHYHSSPPRVGADDATYDGCLGIEVPVGPNEPIWAAVSSSASETTVSLSCGSMLPNARRRLRFDDTGAGLSGLYELIGPKAWLDNEHVANYERRLTYDTQWRGDVYPLYSDSNRYGFLSIVREQSESPVQWNGRALTNDRTAIIRVRHACPRGMFSPAENQCAACPAYMTTDRAGAVAISECKCLQGHGRDANGDCQPCPANTYSADGVTCRACPNGGTSPPQSRLVSYCEPTLPVGYCSRFVIANMTTAWYGNDMDGVYEWDGASVADFPTYRQTTGSLCLGPWFHRTIFRNCATGAFPSPVALWTGGQSPPQTWTGEMVYSFDTATQGFNTQDWGLLFNQPGYPPLSITCLPEPVEQERAPEWVDPPQDLVLSGAAGDIPMGTYTLVGINYTAPVYVLNGMYLAWHSPTRTWGFTQAPDLDGTERWAVAGPMAGQLRVGSTLAVRVFDAASQSFSLAASIMITTSQDQQATTPSASPTSTTSVSPSRSASPVAALSSPSWSPSPTLPPPSQSPTPSATSTLSPAAASSSQSPTRSATAVGSATSSPTSSPAQVSPATPSPTPSPTRSPSRSATQSPTASATRSPSPSSTPSKSPFSTTSPTLTPSQGGIPGRLRWRWWVSPLVAVAVAVPVALLVVAAVAVVALVLVWKYNSLKAPEPLRRRTSVACSSSSTQLHDTPITQQQVNDMYSPQASGFVHSGSS